MDTVYPNDDEIKFRKHHYGGVEDILNCEVKCTICNDDLLHEIISKKMIMVHQSHLFLCCYNCFYKLCEGNKYSCILCKSNKDLSNCIKCNLNVCNRCVENHEIDIVSIGVLNKCFNCVPKMLWKERAQAANVLKVFSSQLCLPNGLLVNETDHEQAVRKYLVKEAKIGQNSKIDNIKNNLCIDFIFKSYKLSITNELSTFSPKDYNPINNHLNEFINICEHVLEKTCSTLTNYKRIFNINSHLSPGVSSIMKSLLKPVDEDDNISVNNSILNGNLNKSTKSNTADRLIKTPNRSTKRNLRSEKKQKIDTNNLSTNISSSSVQPISFPNELSAFKNIDKELTVVIERLDDSIISSMMSNKSSNKIHLELEKNETAHPLNLFDDDNSDSDDNREYTRKLRNRTLKKTNKVKNQTINSTKSQNILNEKSDDEKENDRLTNLKTIEKSSKKKSVTDDEDNSDDTNIIPTNNTSLKVYQNKSNNGIDKLESIHQFLSTLDATDSGTDNDFQNEDNSLESVKCIFTEIKNAIGIPQINTEDNSGDESEDSSINDVINSCLTACKRPSIEHYHNKTQETESSIYDMETIHESELENDIEMSESSDIHNNTTIVTRSSKVTPFKMPSTSDDDSDFEFKIKNKTKGVKRKLLTSNTSKDSDSSSKFFKKTPKRKLKNNVSRTSSCGLTSNSSSNYNSNSSSSSNEDSSPVNVRKRRRIKKLSNDESEEVNDSDNNNASNDRCLPKIGRKNIRKMKKKEELSELTQSALKEEGLRKKRIEKRQQEYNKLCNLPRPMESFKKLVLDFDENTMEELVTVHPDLVKFLKPHQVKGVTFLWNSVFESLARIKEHKGNGSILAHCMGLGKTLQIITLIHTLFRYPDTGIKTVLIITPNATIENWCKEFHKWLHNIDENHFLVLNFTDSKTYEGRKNIIDEWKRDHGVLITSYQLFRSVVNFKNIDKFPTISEGLVDPGPDLIVCDEGHVLKNHSTAISKAVNRIKSLRRIVLTGTPLQNNLREYHCMVDFIRPNLLGSIKDFTNRFINPITNGQYSDSTAIDVRLMKRRSHVLHRMLEGFVQRFDYSVLTPFLPPKHEYVIYLKMADIQIELYQKFLDDHRQPELFSNYHMLQMVWTHPKLLALYLKRAESKREKQKLKNEESRLLNDESSDTDCISNSVDEVESYDLPNTKNPDTPYLNWWKPLISKAKFESVYPYSKFIMMFSILQECENIGDKVLLFSQSLFTLDLIQDFLENAEDIDDEGGPYGKSWDHGLDFYRIDGSTSLKAREDCCERFNDVNNHKMRLLLLSTKAFNLGINLVGANRVIIFDVTWNPSLNVQSIFRVFRFGQNKPCYIYRLISEGTMEQKIYERQISKLSTAFRVVDEHQIDRHFNLKCQEELYEFEPNTTKPKSTLNLPKDRLMAELILKHKDLVMDILEHDSLLQNNEAEELDENDRNAAWEDYEKERDGILTNNLNSTLIHNLNLGFPNVHKSNDDDLKLFNTLREMFPLASMLQLNDMLIKVKDAQNVEQ
ncbi:transcriptional regulator ATRX homolog isoform X3 [Rhopalosiphum padi]|uniref:transcriptional regulator ATRX homolog isoform X3 n=1 Tax=Rhopalosiphum padi TaxID=40932 RepID=UPI00298E96CA|nr:transcriptional regulator ATRX homolog isoform X3 [Rhopalosiphum padi]